jgi:hypothetical protein
MLKDTHSAADLMRGLLTPAPKEAPKGKYLLDDVGADEDAPGAASDYAGQQMRVTAAAIAQQFAATDDLGDDETLADRLMMLVVGAVDADIDGELSEDESQVAEILLNYLWDYLSLKGVSDEDAEALLNNWDADAAARVKDLLAEELPADDEAAAEDIDSFAFDDESSSAIFDSANGEFLYDAVYKKKVVIKNGKKTKINKRISGTVRLNAKQKIAVRKMQRKSHTATATLKRIKSMRKRAQAGL